MRGSKSETLERSDGEVKGKEEKGVRKETATHLPIHLPRLRRSARPQLRECAFWDWLEEGGLLAGNHHVRSQVAVRVVDSGVRK